MTIADNARNCAISLEAKKDALSQRQSGDWKISFTVQSIDMDPRLTQAPMGTRYGMVLVEIGDDEMPVDRKEVQAKPRQIPDKPSDGVKREWRELQPSQQAGIRAGDAIFTAFLKEEYPNVWHEFGDAAQCIRDICEVHSRAEFSTDHRKRVLWHALDTKFEAWKIADQVGA